MALPRRPRAVVFDMDGLLFDTETLYRDCMLAAAAARGHEMPVELYLRMIGLQWESSHHLLRDHFGEGFDIQAFVDLAKADFRCRRDAELALKAGVVEVLDALDALSLPRAIATSSGHESAAHHLQMHGITHRFDAVLAHGDYPRGKPAPDPFLAAAARLGVDPADCLALEDSHNGVRAAAAAGMMTVMVPDLLDPTEEMQSLCVRIAADLHEVERLVRDAWT
jgi:HAD superfamily hydrolase (TIGR01509 family)